MAETTASEEQLAEQNTSSSSSSAKEIDVDSSKPEAGREAGDDKATDSKKRKVDDGKGKAKIDEQSEDKKKKKKNEEAEEASKEILSGPVKLGYKTFDSSVEIFDYFYNFLHSWPLNLNVNKYEHQMLLELLQKGHKNAARKIGVGIRSFQIHKHPKWMGRCFVPIREDGSVDYFRFRKCVHHILPLPDEMLPLPGVDKHLSSKKKYSKQGGRGRGESGK